MLEPNSGVLLVLLIVLAAGLLMVMLRYRRWFVVGPVATLSIVLAMAAGMAVVNDFYGYYQTWAQLSSDLNGSYGHLDSTPRAARGVTAEGRGRLEQITIAGPLSHLTRSALVYLPPQYFEPRFAHTRFPVVELIHGSPGRPSIWTVHLHATQIEVQLMAHRQGGPVVLVMPTMSVGTDFQECVDVPGALDDTYLTADVRSVMEKQFRVSRVAAQWGIAGLSSGGYCAANLALRHPTKWGASGILSGYFRPQDGPAAAALHHNPLAERANDPLLEATRLSSRASPLPSFWIAAGTGDPADFKTALAFAQALHGVEQVTLYREPGAGHTIYAWAGALPHMIAWMWTQLADPALRVQFPIAGPVSNGIINAPPGRRAVAGHHARRRHHRPNRAHALDTSSSSTPSSSTPRSSIRSSLTPRSSIRSSLTARSSTAPGSGAPNRGQQPGHPN